MKDGGVTPAALNSVFSIMKMSDSLPAAQRRRLVSGVDLGECYCW